MRQRKTGEWNYHNAFEITIMSMLKALRQFAYKTLAKKSATLSFTVQKMKFSIKDFFSECDQILQ